MGQNYESRFYDANLCSSRKGWDNMQALFKEADKEISDRQHAEDKNTDLILKLTDELEAKDNELDRLKSELKDYREFAIKNFPDYPHVNNVKNCGDGSIRWCITEGYRGLMMANEDLHDLIKELQS